MNDDLLLGFENQALTGAYREYFIQKRSNYRVVVRDIPELWESFLALDEICVRSLSDLEVQTDRTEVLISSFFRHAHANFRIAFELSFSLAINQAWNLVRTSIDATVIALKLRREPHLMKVWLSKDKGTAELKEYRRFFENERKANLFPTDHGLDELYKFYRFCSEIGSHPGLGSLALRLASKVEGNKMTLNFTYLESNEERILSSIFMVLKPYVLIEAAFFECFKTRLELDDKLADMRLNFQRTYTHAARIVREHFTQTAPGD